MPYDKASLPRHETNQTNAVRTEQQPEPLRHDLIITTENLMQELGKLDRILRWQGKLWSNPEKRDALKHCPFHDDFGHNTPNYIALKYEVNRFTSIGPSQKISGQRK